MVADVVRTADVSLALEFATGDAAATGEAVVGVVAVTGIVAIGATVGAMRMVDPGLAMIVVAPLFLAVDPLQPTKPTTSTPQKATDCLRYGIRRTVDATR